jgi:hypothetical protein
MIVAVNWEGAPPDLVDPLKTESALKGDRAQTASSPRV